MYNGPDDRDPAVPTGSLQAPVAQRKQSDRFLPGGSQVRILVGVRGKLTMARGSVG